MKKIALALVLVLITSILASCGSTPVAPASSAPQSTASSAAPEANPGTDGGNAGKTLKIGFTVNDFNDKWVSYVVDNVKLWDEEHANVEVVLGNGATDVATQMALVEDWIEQGFDAICVKPVEVDATRALAEKCRAANIPYVAVQQKIDEADVTVGPDSIRAGKVEMQAAIDAIGGTGKVLYLSGEAGTLISQQREEGSLAAIEATDGVELVGNEVGNWLRDAAMTIMENWISAGIEFDAVVAANDEMAIGAILAMESAGVREGKIVAGIDGTPDALQMMIEGKLDITMYADPIGLARESLDAAVRLINGETLEDVPLDDLLVLPNEAKEYLAKW